MEKRRSKMDLPDTVRLVGSAYRPVIKTVEEALRFIDRELPIELLRQSRWTFARELLIVASKSGKKRDIGHAFRQLSQALDNDRLLASAVVREEPKRESSTAERPKAVRGRRAAAPRQIQPERI